MKKILYFVTGLFLSGLFAGCNVNDQFDGLDEMSKPTNKTNYDYELTTADYSAIGKIVQKPIADVILLKEEDLKLAANAADSLVIQNEIATLKLDSMYMLGGSITANKYFTKNVLVGDYAPLALQEDFKYADDGSEIMLTYNYHEAYDTTTITVANKYTLLAADYDVMGTGANQPGQNNYFSAAINPLHYIPIWLKTNNSYAIMGDVKLIRYLYYTTSATLVKKVFMYDGVNWIEYPSTTPQVAKFKQKLGVWTFINTDILMGLNANTLIGSNLGDFTPISIDGAAVWAWDSYKYMKITGYLSGPIYNTNEDWLVSPAFSLADRSDSVFLTFDHVARYFNDAAGDSTNMMKSCSVWISTTSDGTTINPADWEQLIIPDYPSGANWTFISSGRIRLKKFIGETNIRIAFKYVSSNTDGFAGTWEVKNCYVFEDLGEE